MNLDLHLGSLVLVSVMMVIAGHLFSEEKSSEETEWETFQHLRLGRILWHSFKDSPGETP